MLPFWIVAGPRLPRQTERKHHFGVWKEDYQAEPETSVRAIHLPNCTAGVSRSVQEEVFHQEVARMKTSVLPGRKWSEALTKRKTDRHKECSLLLLEPGCTDMASLTLVASIKFTATDEKRSAALLARYLKKYWHRLYLSHNQDK